MPRAHETRTDEDPRRDAKRGRKLDLGVVFKVAAEDLQIARLVAEIQLPSHEGRELVERLRKREPMKPMHKGCQKPLGRRGATLHQVEVLGDVLLYAGVQHLNGDGGSIMGLRPMHLRDAAAAHRFRVQPTE